MTDVDVHRRAYISHPTGHAQGHAHGTGAGRDRPDRSCFTFQTRGRAARARRPRPECPICPRLTRSLTEHGSAGAGLATSRTRIPPQTTA